MDEVLLALALIFGIAVVAYLALLPGSIARNRRHHNAQAISLLGIFGIILPLLWFIAIVWSLTDNCRPRKFSDAAQDDRSIGEHLATLEKASHR